MSTNPYSSQTVPASFNSSPPPDDGSQVPANLITWSTTGTGAILTKIGDPLKTFVQNVNAAVLAAFAKTINTDANEANQMAGSLAFAISTLTIAAGVVTATRSVHAIDTEGAAASDDLDTINVASVSDGCLLWLRLANVGRVVTLKTVTGNLVLGEDIVMSATRYVALIRNGSNWNLAAQQGRTGKLIQRAFNSVATEVSIGGTAIPIDNSIPQNTEGVEFITCAVTPLKSTTRLRITVFCNIGAAAANPATIALFRDLGADAIAVASGRVGAASVMEPFCLVHEMASPGTTATTFKVRGGSTGVVTMGVNGTGGGQLFNGVSIAEIIIDEIEA